MIRYKNRGNRLCGNDLLSSSAHFPKIYGKRSFPFPWHWIGMLSFPVPFWGLWKAFLSLSFTFPKFALAFHKSCLIFLPTLLQKKILGKFSVKFGILLLKNTFLCIFVSFSRLQYLTMVVKDPGPLLKRKCSIPFENRLSFPFPFQARKNVKLSLTFP